MYLQGSEKRVRDGIREAQEADLAFTDELAHRADRVLNGSVGIYAVLVVEINVIHAKATEAGFAGFFHVLGLAIDTASHGIGGVANDSELSGEDDLVALDFDGACDQFIVEVRPINIGGIQ